MSDVATVLASDLDRTLVWSTSTLDHAVADSQLPRLRCVEMYLHQPLSFMTERAALLVAQLNELGALLPVTTRTVAQYQRITLPGPPPMRAVCLNGGRLLVNGVEDRDFTARVAQRLVEAAPHGDVWSRLASLCAGSGSFVKSLRDAEGMFCYVVLHESAFPPDWLAEVQEIAMCAGWNVSVQGRKVYCVPGPLSKADAVEMIREQHGSRLLVAGDSKLDADLLDAADAGLMPRGSELEQSGWVRDHVGVTVSTGVMAGQEIAEWLHRDGQSQNQPTDSME